MSRLQKVTIFFSWFIAVFNWILITHRLIYGFNRGFETMKYSEIIRLVSFLVPNIFLLLGLITRCQCLLQPMIFFYQFITWTLWFFAGLSVWVALLPNIFLAPLLKLEQLRQMDRDLDSDGDVLNGLLSLSLFLLASLFPWLLSSVLRRHQKYLRSRDGSELYLINGVVGNMPTSPMLPAITFFLLGLSLTFAASCPTGGIYNNNFNKCYFYFKQPTVFLEAESQCRSIGANLAVIRNGFENTLVADLVISQSNGTPPTNFWIGVNLLLASKWTWTTNDTALYTNWAPDEPIDPSNFDCGSVRTDGSNLWKKGLCYSALPFVCTADTIDVPSDSPCDPEYIEYENQCFRLFTGFVNRLHYYAADRFCRDQNATLPKITTAGMQNFVAALVFDVQSATWLGLGCDGTNGINDCVWWDETHPTYTNYAPGEPIGRYPIGMISPGQWYSQQDFWPLSTAVVCQKPVRA